MLHRDVRVVHEGDMSDRRSEEVSCPYVLVKIKGPLLFELIQLPTIQ